MPTSVQATPENVTIKAPVPDAYREILSPGALEFATPGALAGQADCPIVLLASASSPSQVEMGSFAAGVQLDPQQEAVDDAVARNRDADVAALLEIEHAVEDQVLEDRGVRHD